MRMRRYGPCRGFRDPIDRRHSDFIIHIAVQFDFDCLSVTWNDILFLSKNKCRRSTELVNFYGFFPDFACERNRTFPCCGLFIGRYRKQKARCCHCTRSDIRHPRFVCLCDFIFERDVCIDLDCDLFTLCGDFKFGFCNGQCIFAFLSKNEFGGLRCTSKRVGRIPIVR